MEVHTNRFQAGFLRPCIFALVACLTFCSDRAHALDLSEQLSLSGYGNFHGMDHSGLPRFTNSPDGNDLFYQMREFSLFFDFDVAEGVIASLELEAGKNGTHFSSNYAYVQFDIPTFVDCWDEEQHGSLNVSVGRILVPFLSYNENKLNFKQTLMSPPFTAQNFAPVVPLPADFFGLDWSDTGVSGNYTKYVESIDSFFSLKFATIEGLSSDSNVLDANFRTLTSGPTVRIRDGLRQNEQDQLRDGNRNKATVLQASFALSDLPINAGFSWYRGSWNPAGDKDLNMYGLHFNWLAHNWTLKAEYGWGDVEQDAGSDPVTDAGLTGPGFNASTGNYGTQSWYVEGSYIVLRWGEGSDRYLRMIYRYDMVDTNDALTGFNPFDRNRHTIGTEIQIIPGARLRYEWQYHTLQDFSLAPAPFLAAGGEEHVKMHMASVIFYF